MAKQKLMMACLFQAQLFETFWAYYIHSNFFEKECRNAATQFIVSYEKLLDIDSKYATPIEVCFNTNEGLKFFKDWAIECTTNKDILINFKEWSVGSKLYPYNTLSDSNLMLLLFLASVKSLLLQDLKISKEFKFTAIYGAKHRYRAQFIRWAPHLPQELSDAIENPDELISHASTSKSIVLIGDIRRSQDLMTYSIDPDLYSTNMEQFITTTKKLIDNNLGFFDKFTGDGFIVYFNNVMCNINNQNYIDCFINFIRDEMNFAIPFFENWERSIRRRPVEKIGLALGADMGKIEFKDIKNHLIAVGDAIVWGTRMASSSLANEILVNNLLHSVLIERNDISLREHRGKTKSGENFLAYKLNILENVD
jgi:class 3 adenylate cyclase